MVDAFSLKFQRDNRKNALAVDPAKGKIGKKAVFSPYCIDKTTTYYKEPKRKGSAIVSCCFILQYAYHIDFFPNFLTNGLYDWGVLGAFYSLFHWNFKK